MHEAIIIIMFLLLLFSMVVSPEGFVRIEQSTFLAYPGETVTFQCIADAGPNNTFTWLFDAADQFCIACSDPQPDNATSM